MKIFNKPCLTVLLFLVFFQVNNVFAGATPLRKGTWLVSLSFSYFEANRVWDKDGKSAAYPDSGYFNSAGIYLYTEYGLSRRVTLVGSIPFSYSTYSQTNFTSITHGFGDGEFGARYYLMNINFKFYLGLQTTLIVPLYRNTANSNLGFETMGAEVKLMGTGTQRLSGDQAINYGLEFGVREYFDNSGPVQFKPSASLGYNFDHYNALTLGATAIKSISPYTTFNAVVNQAKDFSYLQASLSYGHAFTPHLSMYASYARFLIGRNTGIGNNLGLSVVARF